MVFTAEDYVKGDWKGPLEDWKGQGFQVFLYFYIQVFLYFSPFVSLP